jgi:hypothetical protein
MSFRKSLREFDFVKGHAFLGYQVHRAQTIAQRLRQCGPIIKAISNEIDEEFPIVVNIIGKDGFLRRRVTRIRLCVLGDIMCIPWITKQPVDISGC